METLYGIYRPQGFGPERYSWGTLNGGYKINFYLNGHFKPLVDTGQIVIEEAVITDEMYTTEVDPTGHPGVIDNLRFIKIIVDIKVGNETRKVAEIEESLVNFSFERLSNSNDAIGWIEDNTDRVEGPNGQFLIRDAYINDQGVPQDAVYLIID